MQEKRRNISPVKDRILYYIENLSISKREFYSKTGISRGTLESPTGITEDTLAKFIATYPEVSLEWLIRGEGEIVRPNGPEEAPADLLEMASQSLSGEKYRQFSVSVLSNVRRALETDEKDLEWFTLKFDYRNQAKPWGNSRDALERTVNRLRGFCVGGGEMQE